jgi:heat shock protein HslJ
MSKPDHLRLAFLLAGLFLLAACGPAATPAPGARTAEPRATTTPKVSVSLEGTEWALASLRGDKPVAGSSLTLAFYEDNYMEGTAGCNSYGVEYTESGQGFHIAAIHRTDFECEEPPGIMPQDEAFFEALASIAAYRAAEDRLEFDNAEGETILVYARKLPAAVDPALRDTEWLLTSLLGDSLLEGSRITLNLGKEGFDGVAGCNNYGGEYDAASGGIMLTSDIFTTAMDCGSPEGIMEQETAYIQALRSSATYRLPDGRLEISDASAETILVYARKAEYGTDPTALLRTVWRLASVDGDNLSERSAFTLAFYSEYILGGHAGCRDYLATYQASGDDLNVLYEVMLDAGCRVEDADFEQEAQVMGVLAPKADLRLGEGHLEIYGERGGVLVFESLTEEAALDLEGTAWSLLAFVGPNPYAEEPEPWPVPGGLLAGTAIDLTFEGDMARGSAGCNRYGAPYSRTGSSIDIGTLTLTEMACLGPEGVMEQEAHYLELLTSVTGYHFYGDRLWLETDDGQALVLRASLPRAGFRPAGDAAPTPTGLVLQAGGLAMVHFGDDALAVLEMLDGILGTPDYDSGWQDPSMPSSEPLWPGC